jgi:hypothetical protein
MRVPNWDIFATLSRFCLGMVMPDFLLTVIIAGPTRGAA